LPNAGEEDEVSQSETAKSGRTVTELSNAMVAMHRQTYGRGPGGAKSFLSDDIAVCVLTDIFTQVERTLIEAGQADHVRRTRVLHETAIEAEYRVAVEAVLGRRVEACMSVIHVDPDVVVQTFLLDR
jgi:uncharacterized protein YbcI